MKCKSRSVRLHNTPTEQAAFYIREQIFKVAIIDISFKDRIRCAGWKYDHCAYSAIRRNKGIMKCKIREYPYTQNNPDFC